MTIEIAIVLALVAAVFTAFVRERMPPDIIAMSSIAVLVGIGILTIDEALSVFSNGAVFTILCMFIISAALERTGVLTVLGRYIIRFAGTSHLRAMLAVTLPVAFLSAFMNNTPLVVVLTPVVMALSKTSGIPASKLLMPMSFAAVLGGVTTLIGTSTNLLVAGITKDAGLPEFHMFEITAAGSIMAAVGMAYLYLVASRFIPERSSMAAALTTDKPFLTEAMVPAESPLIGKTLEESSLNREDRMVLDIIRSGRSLRYNLGTMKFKAGDTIIFQAKTRELLALHEGDQVELSLPEKIGFQPINAEEKVIMEGIVAPRSWLAGRPLSHPGLTRLYGVYVMALHRRETDYQKNLETLTVRPGDTLLFEGPAEGIRSLIDDNVVVSLTHIQDRAVRRAKAPIALFALLGVVLLAALNIMPIEAAALIAAFAVVLSGCVDADDLYSVIDWRILFLIWGTLGLALGMEKSGAMQLIVDSIIHVVEGMGPMVVLAAIYLLATILTEILSNNAVAVILCPIVIGLAESMGVDSRPFLVAIMFAASASFATPIGYQTNTFVYNAGGYKFMDFVKIGLPMNILMFITAMIVIPMFWSF